MPDFAAEVRRRLDGLSLAPGREAEIVEELTQHLEDRARDLRAGGMAAMDAGATALTELEADGVLVRAVAAAERRVNPDPPVAGGTPRGGWGAQLTYDLRFALRSLRLHPAFTLTVALTLALGIGGTTAIFTLVDGILLRPLPFPQPDRLVQVMQTYPELGLDSWTLSQGNVAIYRDRSRSFDGFAAYTRPSVNLTGGAQPGQLLRSVLGQGLMLSGAGAAVGLLGAFALTRYLRNMLYEVSPTDPVVFTLLPLGLVGIALVACWLPAWRAGRSDPLAALREE